jgi:hypothetical protein
MGKLVSDPFLRGFAQVIVVASTGALMLICVGIDLAVVSKYLGRLNDMKEIVLILFQALALPFKSLAAQITVVFGSLVPIVLATVCFKVDTSAVPPAPGDELNAVGRVVVIIMAIGMVAAFVALAMFSAFSEAVIELVGSLEIKERIAAAIAAVMSFQAIYFAQLTGLKPK